MYYRLFKFSFYLILVKKKIITFRVNSLLLSIFFQINTMVLLHVRRVSYSVTRLNVVNFKIE